MIKTAVIAFNGILEDNKMNKYREIINKADIYIAADGGEKLFSFLEVMPHIIIGDFDSLDEKKLHYYKKNNTKLIKYPSEKDESDSELALLYCQNKNISNIIFTNTLGGRIDHQLANLFLLEFAQNLGLKAVIKEPDIEIGIIDDKKEFIDRKGEILSIIPLSEKVDSIDNYGCKYPLSGETLLRYKSRGISNIIINDKAGVSCSGGTVLYILNKNN